MISHHSSHHSGIGGRHSVVHVDVQLSERAYVYPELLFIRNELGQLTVEGMYALYDDRLVFSYRHYPLAESLSSLYEIEFRQINFFTCKKIIHVAVEEFYIQSAQPLVVRVSLFVKRRLRSFHEVIVSPHVKRIQAVDSQLHAETLGCSGLAGGGWPCYEDYPLLSFCDHISHLSDLLLVKSFGEQDQVFSLALSDLFVKVRHIVHSQKLLPVLGFAECYMKVFIVMVFRYRIRISRIRESKQYPFCVFPQFKKLRTSCRRRYASVEIIAVIFKLVNLSFFYYRKVRCYYFFHPICDSFHLLLCNRF